MKTTPKPRPALDADALGFVFAPSGRQVHPETVRDIAKRLPREVHTIGVFRNERPERIVEIVGRTGLHGVQLHGAEPASEVKWIRERVQFVIQAFAAGDPALAAAGKSGRHHPRRLARSRFGQGVRLAARRGRAEWHPLVARGRAHARQRR